MLEALEPRYAPALIVTSDLDSGSGSLRAILSDPNLQNGAVINFGAALTGPTGQTINLTSEIDLKKTRTANST